MEPNTRCGLTLMPGESGPPTWAAGRAYAAINRLLPRPWVVFSSCRCGSFLPEVRPPGGDASGILCQSWRQSRRSHGPENPDESHSGPTPDRLCSTVRLAHDGAGNTSGNSHIGSMLGPVHRHHSAERLFSARRNAGRGSESPFSLERNDRRRSRT